MNASLLRHRRSIRLPGYDYSQPGAYFVTICTRGRSCVLGDVSEGVVRLSKSGQIAQDTWMWLGSQYLYVELHEYVIMPNHLHGLIMIHDVAGRGGSRAAPATDSMAPLELGDDPISDMIKVKPMGELVGAFKTVSTKQVNLLRGSPGAQLWQRGFYEHVVRKPREIDRLRTYIVQNPLKWELDEYHPYGEPGIALNNEWGGPRAALRSRGGPGRLTSRPYDFVAGLGGSRVWAAHEPPLRHRPRLLSLGPRPTNARGERH